MINDKWGILNQSAFDQETERSSIKTVYENSRIIDRLQGREWTISVGANLMEWLLSLRIV